MEHPSDTATADVLPEPISRRKLVVGVFSLFALTSLLVFATMRAYMPLTAATQRTSDVSIKGTIDVELNVIVKSVPLEQIAISPAVDGNWSVTKGNLFTSDSLTFTPSTHFNTGTTYTIQIPALSRIIAGKTDPKSIEFTTEAAPGIANSGVANLKDGSTIAADYTFEIDLADGDSDLRDLDIKTTPAVKLSKSSDARSYTWAPNGLLPQGKKIKIEVYDSISKSTLLTKSITVANAPKITSPTSRILQSPNDPVVIKFDQPIAEPASDSIKFSTPGSGKWTDSNTYTFTPTKLAAGGSYNYNVAKGLRSSAGGITTSAIKGTFDGRGAVRVSASTPWGSELSQVKQTISFTFDQPVEKSSAERRFSVSSGKVGAFRWNGQTMSVDVTSLGYQRTVSATVGAGVRNTDFGLPSNQAFSVSFTTEIRSRKLNVPFYSQQHRSTCAVASLRMALAYRGTNTSEMAIVDRMGYAPTKLNKKTNPHTWDDPQLMFVGHIDGSLSNGTAAGPDAPPVAKAARSYGRNASSVTGIGSGWIARQIYAGHPVIMFGAFNSSSAITSWKTPSGRIAKMNLSSHATTVIGVHGEPSNPLGFWVNDPLAGGTAYWSTGAVEANIARDPYRQATVVY